MNEQAKILKSLLEIGCHAYKCPRAIYVFRHDTRVEFSPEAFNYLSEEEKRRVTITSFVKINGRTYD